MRDILSIQGGGDAPFRSTSWLAADGLTGYMYWDLLQSKISDDLDE